MPVGAAPDLAALYEETRRRVDDLVRPLDGDQLATAVPACPGWSVADVVAHLTAVAEDVLAGRLTSVPGDDETAAQVDRFGHRPTTEVLDTWARVGPEFAGLIAAATVWPGLLDVVSHEQDLRGALDRPGARDSAGVRVGAERLATWLQPSVPLVIRVEDAEFVLGPDGAEPLELRTTRFETLRWRLGRRSRAQLAAMAWSGPPDPVLDELCVFGPAPLDIVE